jgi:hypothetical protein
MATERQISANRANANRSTGPKTAVGRRASCRNALRHGLSSSAPPQQTVPVDIDELAKALVPSDADESQIMAAWNIALANMEVLRVRGVRAALLALLDSSNGHADILCQLRGLERYERVASGKRRIATKRLWMRRYA